MHAVVAYQWEEEVEGAGTGIKCCKIGVERKAKLPLQSRIVVPKRCGGEVLPMGGLAGVEAFAKIDASRAATSRPSVA